LNSKFELNENSSPTACTCCWQRAIIANNTIRLLGKKALRQQHGSPVGEGLFPLPTTNGEAVGEADGVDTVWPRRGFAKQMFIPNRNAVGKEPLRQQPNFAISLWILGCWRRFLSRQHSFPVGKDFFANSSGLGCWESSGLLAKPQFPVVPGGA
jgi:hypothetical protein